MTSIINNMFVKKTQTIRETMQIITNSSKLGAPAGLAIVIDEFGQMIGIVTDGDIRRGLVGDYNLDSIVTNIMTANPITVPTGLTENEMMTLVTEQIRTTKKSNSVRINHLIVKNQDGTVADVIDFFDLWKNMDMKNHSVCIFGLGFVGLTLGITLADVGYKVIGYDLKEDIVHTINKGIAPFHEKGLSSLLKFHVSKKNFVATKSLVKNQADVYIFSVGTPIDKNNKPNLEFIEQASRELAPLLKKKDLVLLRSTVPIGTTNNVVKPILEKGSGLKAGEDFFLAFAPERTIEGKALEELRTLPQVVGGLNKKSQELAANFFSNLNNTIIKVSSLEAAEMVKLANNCFRDLSFSFANEMAQVCDKMSLNINEIITSANEGYPRNRIPVPSPGVGGVCLKKDPYIYAESARLFKAEASLAIASRKINEQMPRYISEKISHFLDSKGKKEAKIFIIGFAFKGEPETSDMRDSPTLDVLSAFKKRSNYKLFGYDPVISKSEIDKLEIEATGLKEGFKNADAVVIMNNHRSYRDTDILGLCETMNKESIFIDGWNLFPKEEFTQLDGIFYGGLSG